MSRILIALVAILSAASCSRPPGPPAAQIDPGLSTMVPPDTILLVSINADALRKTPLYQKYLMQREIPQLDEFGRYTGMDPRKDLWQLLLVSDGKHNVLFGRGNFGDDMETHLIRDGAAMVPYKAYHLVGNQEGSVVFFNSSTAAVGNVESLKALIDARGMSSGPPQAIVQRMKEIPGDSQVWAVYTGGGVKLPFALQGNLANVDKVLESVQDAEMHLDARNGIQGGVVLYAANDEASKKLNETLRGLIGFGRLSVPSNAPDLVQFFDGLKPSQDGPKVNLKIEESEQLLEKFLSQSPLAR